MTVTLSVFGQKSKGNINGTVTGANNSPAAGVMVTATNQVTSQVWRAKTGTDGSYSFSLPTGAYQITVETNENVSISCSGANGYNDRSCENRLVGAGAEATKIDIKLQPRKEGSQIGPVPKDVPPVDAGQPLGSAGKPSVKSEPPEPTRANIIPLRDRWRGAFPEYSRYGDKGAQGRDIPFRKGRLLNPYDQNILKGDYPIFGQDFFFILSAVSTTTTEYNRTPKPSDTSSRRPGSAEFFGKAEAFILNQILQVSLEGFKGDSTFRPRTLSFKISPTFSIPNYVNARENGVVSIDPRVGTTRLDAYASLEDAFAEVKLEDVNSNFDFVSVRVGIQPFTSDFRGFIFSDNNLGARFFGGFGNNKYQFNAAYFSQLEKDTNSGLIQLFKTRHQNVYIANLFKQDFLRKGFTGELSFHYNDDRATLKYDKNGILVRPAAVGDIRPHSIKVGYIGAAVDGHLGDGKLGRPNIDAAYYLALGNDSRNPISGEPERIRAQMAAVELTLDKDYFRYRLSAFYTSGDKNPKDRKATGFDAIIDDPNFLGGQFSFFNRQGIRLPDTGVALVEPNSLIPSLRSSKIQGQANFVNPGIFIANAGFDVDLTQKFKAIANVSYLRFNRTESLEYLLFQNRIRHELGYDYSVGFEYRPLLINNIQLNFGASLFQPGRGFRDIYTDKTRNCPPNVAAYCNSDNVIVNPSNVLFSAFAQLKLIF
ncbi:MAG: hypothetical protein NVSMB56_01090 [Pyrinomonadaceae bacterium]